MHATVVVHPAVVVGSAAGAGPVVGSGVVPVVATVIVPVVVVAVVAAQEVPDVVQIATGKTSAEKEGSQEGSHRHRSLRVMCSSFSSVVPSLLSA